MNTSVRPTYSQTLMKGLLLLLAASWTLPATAEMLVQSLSGDAGQYQLVRDDTVLGLQPLKVLKAGDVVKVTGPQAALSLVGDDGKVVTVTAGNSPFVVPQAEPRGWMDNAMLAALDWYQGVSNETVQTVSLVTRGQGQGPVQLLGMDLDENLIPAGSGEIRFRWDGGSAPYRVDLLDAEGRLMAGSEVTGREFSYLSDALPAGDYRIRVQSLGDTPPQLDEQGFTAINPAELPAEVRQLQASEMVDPLRRHLSAVLLAQYPEWRFASLQLSLAADDSRLSDALLFGAVPVGK